MVLAERVGPEPYSFFADFNLKIHFLKHGVTNGVTVFAVLSQRTIFSKGNYDLIMPQDAASILLIV